jgi:hypothetical protein
MAHSALSVSASCKISFRFLRLASSPTRTRLQCPLGLNNEDGGFFGAIRRPLVDCRGLDRVRRTGPFPRTDLVRPNASWGANQSLQGCQSDAVRTRLSSLAQWLGPEEGQQRRVELPEIPKRGASQEGLWGQNRTEPAAGWPPRGSGRHPGQQARVPEEELPACSASQVCFVRGVGSPCSHARHSARNAPVCPRVLRASESRRGST